MYLIISMSYKIENDIILDYIKKGNTYFDILIYNSCNFKKTNEFLFSKPKYHCK